MNTILNPKCVKGLGQILAVHHLAMLLLVCVCVLSITGHAGDWGRVSFFLVQLCTG